MQHKTKPESCHITVTNSQRDAICYINQPCPITWDTSNISNYGSVFLSVIQWDTEHFNGDFEGQKYPVSNTGNYQWTVPANVGPLNNTAYIIKIITSDYKCEGQNKPFGIKMKFSKEDLKMRMKSN